MGLGTQNVLFPEKGTLFFFSEEGLSCMAFLGFRRSPKDTNPTGVAPGVIDTLIRERNTLSVYGP